MELVHGQPLGDYLREQMGRDYPSPAQLRQRLRLFGMICRAVSYAHQRLRAATSGPGSDAPAQTLSIFGQTLRWEKKCDESQKIGREVLATRQARQGPESAEAAYAMDELAETLTGKNAYAEARGEGGEKVILATLRVGRRDCSVFEAPARRSTRPTGAVYKESTRRLGGVATGTSAER